MTLKEAMAKSKNGKVRWRYPDGTVSIIYGINDQVDVRAATEDFWEPDATEDEGYTLAQAMRKWERFTRPAWKTRGGIVVDNGVLRTYHTITAADIEATDWVEHKE